MSKLFEILDYVGAAQTALALQIGGKALPVVVRKVPKREEIVDSVYQTTVSGAEDVDQTRRFAFGSVWYVKYRVQITAITPGDRDTALDYQDLTNWREATRAFFMKPGAIAVDGVQDVHIPKSNFLPMKQMDQSYDWNQVVLLVTTYERRS